MTGPCAAVSGDKLPAGGLGGLLSDGSTAGASAGVEELDGMLGEASGVVVLDGTSACGGAPTGEASGPFTGALPGVETGAGGGTGDNTFVDGLGVGETTVSGGLAGDFSGAIEGDVAGGVETGAVLVGVDAGGDKVGDFEGDGGADAGEMEGEEDGEVAGELDGEGDFDGGVVVVGFGEGAGALSACTTPERKRHKTSAESTRSLCIFGNGRVRRTETLRVYVNVRIFTGYDVFADEFGECFREAGLYIESIVSEIKRCDFRNFLYGKCDRWDSGGAM